MTELKTLKDISLIEGYCVAHDIEAKNNLREEAIKWIKDTQENNSGMQDRITWIKHFFNITEEELK